MAAGLGRRFGGTKQLAVVGPNGEAFIDYAINDAIEAGCQSVVVIVRSEIESDVARHLARTHPDGPKITLICQDSVGPKRARPWGTGHAVLSAADSLDAPFIVVNADDYYGASSYVAAVEGLRNCDPDEALLTAFELAHTVPQHGDVSRGVCEVVDEHLVGIEEMNGLTRSDGQILHTPSGDLLPPQTPVSLNLWGFQPNFLTELRPRVESFMALNADDDTVECLLPAIVHDLIVEKIMRVRVVNSAEQWIGVTNPNDLEIARKLINSVRV